MRKASSVWCRKLPRFFCIAPILILIPILPLAGQADSGTVVITVEEPMGPVGGALIQSEGRSARTDAEGRARLVLPAGVRSLSLSRIGYLPKRLEIAPHDSTHRLLKT